jgi:hypothetical protein
MGINLQGFTFTGNPDPILLNPFPNEDPFPNAKDALSPIPGSKVELEVPKFERDPKSIPLDALKFERDPKLISTDAPPALTSKPQSDLKVLPLDPKLISTVSLALKTHPSLPVGQWKEPYVREIIQQNGVSSVSDLFLGFVAQKQQEIKNAMEWLKDLIDEINKKCNGTKKLLAKMKQLSDQYAVLFQELKLELGEDSTYVRCINKLKQFQIAIQNLRITVLAILEEVRLLTAQANNPELKQIKRELKLIDDHCRQIITTTDCLIDRLTLLLRVLHERSFEKRSRGL